MILINFKVLIYRFHKLFKNHLMSFTSYNIPLWRKSDLVETIYGIVAYSSYHNCIFSLKMAYTAEICRWL